MINLFNVSINRGILSPLFWKKRQGIMCNHLWDGLRECSVSQPPNNEYGREQGTNRKVELNADLIKKCGSSNTEIEDDLVPTHFHGLHDLWVHRTTNTPQPHPLIGECFSPPLGGDKYCFISNTKERLIFRQTYKISRSRCFSLTPSKIKVRRWQPMSACCRHLVSFLIPQHIHKQGDLRIFLYLKR